MQEIKIIDLINGNKPISERRKHRVSDYKIAIDIIKMAEKCNYLVLDFFDVKNIKLGVVQEIMQALYMLRRSGIIGFYVLRNSPYDIERVEIHDEKEFLIDDRVRINKKNEDN